MKIYLGHATSFDYINELYLPIKSSNIYKKHQWTLPHDQELEPFNSKLLINACDLFIAEVSYPSTGLGIELGWANIAECEILCFYQNNFKPSSSLKIICKKFVPYSNVKEMLTNLEYFLMT